MYRFLFGMAVCYLCVSGSFFNCEQRYIKIIFVEMCVQGVQGVQCIQGVQDTSCEVQDMALQSTYDNNELEVTKLYQLRN